MPRIPASRRTVPRAVRLLLWAGTGACLLAVLPAPVVAQPAACEALRERIERTIRDNGVVDARVVVAERGNAPPGRLVGDCDAGRRVLVYRRDGVAPVAPAGSAPAVAVRSPALAVPPPPARPAAAPVPVITECADGSQPADGRCPPARR